jgi:organic radical activating enzyme
VCSPKTSLISYNLIAELELHFGALKYVLEDNFVNETNGLPLCTLGHKTANLFYPPPGWRGQIFVQPLDVKDKQKNKANLEACIKSCQKFGYTLCMQLHKIINLP